MPAAAHNANCLAKEMVAIWVFLIILPLNGSILAAKSSGSFSNFVLFSEEQWTWLVQQNIWSDFCRVPQCALSGIFNSDVKFHHFLKDETWKMRIRNVRLENFLIKKAATVCSRHFLSADVIQGGRRCLWEGVVPVLFAWKYYSLPAARLTVWERTQHLEDEVTEQEKMDVESVPRSRRNTRTSSFSCSTYDFYGHHWPAEHF